MIYLDNCATTYPKPKAVRLAVCDAVGRYSFNSGRGGYRQAADTAQMIYDTRESIADMFNLEAQNTAFTQSCTFALNMAIKGTVKKGDHIIISNLEHNAVARPVYALYEQGIISYDTAEFSYDAEKTVNNFKKLIRPDTKAIVCMHASNVFGCVFPIGEIGKLAHNNGITFIVDAAQSAGIIDIDAKRDGIDILCAPGHKGLYGPVGIGFAAAANNIKLKSIIEGGTGSSSMRLEQPDFLPDMLEPGTMNNIGIAGLNSGAAFVKSKGIKSIYSHEKECISYIYNEFNRLDKITLYTPHPNDTEAAPVLSFNLKDYPSEKTARLLADRGIAVRAGFHCAGLAHKAFGTTDRGTVRICPSVFTSYRECEIFINTLKKL